MSDRHIEVTGSAGFKTRPVLFPVEVMLTTSRQTSNAERFRLARTMEGLIDGLIEGGVPAARIPTAGETDPLRHLRHGEEMAPRAELLIECRSAEELAQVHGLAAKLDHGDAKLTVTDLPLVYGPTDADRARAYRAALVNAGQITAAIAHEAGVKLGPLQFARELDTDAPEKTTGEKPVQITVRLLTRFEIT